MSLVAKVAGQLPGSWIKTVSQAQWRNPLFKRGFDWCANRFRNRDGVIQQGVGKGLRFNTGRSNAGYLLGTSEPNVQHAMATVLGPGMTFYDVGANVGFHAMIAARLVGPRGRVICFEPFPDNADQVKYNARLNGFGHVSVRLEALGEADREGSFLISDESTWGRLDDGKGVPTKFAGTMSVPVRRLDSVLREPGMLPPDVIKVDVEGGEVAVLAGAAETLRKYRPIMMIELHGTNDRVVVVLNQHDYAARVLGSSASITESPWYAYVVAVPAEKPELLQKIGKLCRSPLSEAEA